MTTPELLRKTEDRFLKELRHHFLGWITKVERDLSEDAFRAEIANLVKDPVYSAFGLDSAEYALVRMMGRLSISIGRRLGEIYDKIPRYVTQARFGLQAHDVAPKVDGKLELDVCVPLDRISTQDREHVLEAVRAHLPEAQGYSGVAIEIRYNFNPNDSARLRKDEDMAKLLRKQQLLPLYLIFSSISPRDEAIARLTRAGWTFLVGNTATYFINELIGMDIQSILQSDSVKKEVAEEMARIMRSVYQSFAVRLTLEKYSNQ